MAKLFSILFSSIILLQSFNISIEDFSKLSILMEHADLHQEIYGDTFFDFISEHYGFGNIQHGGNHDEHDELPFKHNHQTCHHAPVTFTINITNIDLKSGIFIETPFNYFYKESHSLFEKPSVFQPPKSA